VKAIQSYSTDCPVFPLAQAGTKHWEEFCPGATMLRKHDNFIQIPRRNCRMGSSEFPLDRQPDAAPISPSSTAADLHQPAQSPEELQEESRKIRRFQMVMNMVMQVIAQDQSITVDEASEMVADTRRVALGMFPDKELAFNLIYWPRLQRLMRERFRMQ
jgi:hypothetical protein